MKIRTITAPGHGPARRLGLGAWMLACCVALALIWFLEHRARIAELTLESERLRVAVSQRADQHDAHLTALSAVAIASAGDGPDLFGEVAATIMRFYPRITRILLVALDPAEASLSAGKGNADIGAAVRRAASSSAGAPVLLRHPSDRGAYLIVKRSPSKESARYGLALVIDGAALMAGDSDFWLRETSSVRLTMPDGTVIAQGSAPLPAPMFSAPLDSGTQPLRLESAVTITPAALLPPGRVALILAAITLAALGAQVALRQRARVRAAERRAELSDLETRLGHASRVNALGEMASGMAHELTQPLTAILAQTQAARHLAARGETDRLVAILGDVVGQTRRASAILERLRNWTRPASSHPRPVDLRDCVRTAQSLLERSADEAGAALCIQVPKAAVQVLADQVELEQVIFNLVRNALDAVAGTAGDRAVTVTLSADQATARLEVNDTGPGIRPDVRQRLFTPFVTTRDGGTGLGLALSHRLAERAGGDLVLAEGPGGARFRLSLPLADAVPEAAE
ncbi:sensor histidine kinase [Cribrihabitans pelagius]|uniref:sensor histidine kinase n=1 Tax=Cribrihabitans pelagius TaxID=1765746 RepID=UPI003B5C6B3F